MAKKIVKVERFALRPRKGTIGARYVFATREDNPAMVQVTKFKEGNRLTFDLPREEGRILWAGLVRAGFEEFLN